ncbi:MAG: nodulation protein NfeD [Deltaproteobacteria bacterium]|nr:nodulation protein NfeD [Deltaproteobacteria bacterium]
MKKRGGSFAAFLNITLTVFILSIPSVPYGAGWRAASPGETLKETVKEDNPAPIYYVKAEGVVNPVMSEYIIKNIERAGDEGAGAVVIELDTPGGLDLSMRDIVKKMLSSEVPVVVYVAPAGARAASAGVFITYASSVAAMAPGTNIGSAHPVSMGREKTDEVMMKKVENDAVAYIKGIAKKRNRNADWAEKAVRDSVNITAEEALKLGVVDILAQTRGELIAKLDARLAWTASGEVPIRTKDSAIEEIEMDLRFRVLNAISNPNVAYILMMLGLVGIYFELSNPGAVLPGVVGAICLVLSFYAFQTLSVNYAGLILIGLALIFFILEIKVTSFGLLTLAGVASLLLGSLMLFSSPLPFMRVSLWVVLPAVIVVTLFSLGTMYYAVRIHRRRPVSGVEGLTGGEGVAVDEIGPIGPCGKVFVKGEYWEAESAEPIERGARVRVVRINGMRLEVVKV